MAISDSKELAKAVNQNQNVIEIEGDLTKKVIKIKATGPVAWAIAIAALGASAALLLASPATLGTSGIASAVTGTAAVTILGGPAAATALAIAVAGGGIGTLNSLRKYKIVEKTSTKVILKRK